MNCKEALIELRNIQMANKQLRNAEAQMGANPNNADAIAEEMSDIADWVSSAQDRTTWSQSLWDNEPVTL